MDQFNEFIDNVEKIVRKYDNESDILYYTKQLLEEILHYPEYIPKEIFKSRKYRFAVNGGYTDRYNINIGYNVRMIL